MVATLNLLALAKTAYLVLIAPQVLVWAMVVLLMEALQFWQEQFLKSHLKKLKRLKKLIQLLKSKKMDFTKAKSFQAKMVSISDAILKPA